MQKLISVLLLAVVLPAVASNREIAQSVFLMETCQKDFVACDVIIQTNLDNIRIFTGAEDRQLMASFFNVSDYSCVDDLTAAEVRTELQLSYRDIDFAKLGASQMVFNSIMAAASRRCRGQSI